MNINMFPSKKQFLNWNLPSKSSYIGCLLTIIFGIISFFPIQKYNFERPYLSILTLDNNITNDSFESIITFKNISNINAYIIIETKAYINNLACSNDNPSCNPQLISPDQIINCKVFYSKKPEFIDLIKNDTTNVNINLQCKILYGKYKENVNDYYIYNFYKLDIDELKKVL